MTTTGTEDLRETIDNILTQVEEYREELLGSVGFSKMVSSLFDNEMTPMVLMETLTNENYTFHQRFQAASILCQHLSCVTTNIAEMIEMSGEALLLFVFDCHDFTLIKETGKVIRKIIDNISPDYFPTMNQVILEHLQNVDEATPSLIISSEIACVEFPLTQEIVHQLLFFLTDEFRTYSLTILKALAPVHTQQIVNEFVQTLVDDFELFNSNHQALVIQIISHCQCDEFIMPIVITGIDSTSESVAIASLKALAKATNIKLTLGVIRNIYQLLGFSETMEEYGLSLEAFYLLKVFSSRDKRLQNILFDTITEDLATYDDERIKRGLRGLPLVAHMFSDTRETLFNLICDSPEKYTIDLTSSMYEICLYDRDVIDLFFEFVVEVAKQSDIENTKTALKYFCKLPHEIYPAHPALEIFATLAFKETDAMATDFFFPLGVLLEHIGDLDDDLIAMQIFEVALNRFMNANEDTSNIASYIHVLTGLFQRMPKYRTNILECVGDKVLECIGSPYLEKTRIWAINFGLRVVDQTKEMDDVRDKFLLDLVPAVIKNFQTIGDQDLWYFCWLTITSFVENWPSYVLDSIATCCNIFASSINDPRSQKVSETIGRFIVKCLSQDIELPAASLPVFYEYLNRSLRNFKEDRSLSWAAIAIGWLISICDFPVLPSYFEIIKTLFQKERSMDTAGVWVEMLKRLSKVYPVLSPLIYN